MSADKRDYIARLDRTTGLAIRLNPNANGSVGAIAVQADGKILVGGGFTNIGGDARNGLARLDPTTGLVDSFIRSITVVSLHSRCRRTARFCGGRFH